MCSVYFQPSFSFLGGFPSSRGKLLNLLRGLWAIPATQAWPPTTRGGFKTNFTHSDILEPCTLIHFGWWEMSIENQNVWGREILVSSIFVGLCSLSMCTYSDVVGVI